MKKLSTFIAVMVAALTIATPAAKAADWMLDGGFDERGEYSARVGVDILSFTDTHASDAPEPVFMGGGPKDDGGINWWIVAGVVAIVAVVAITASETSDSGNRNGTSGTTDQANDESISTAVANALRGSKAGGDINATFNINVSSTVAPLE